jgi:hypothetical protein
VGQKEGFLPPSRRFCSLTCCKRYSAEKRYYPYGRDEEGIAKSISEGLLNPRSRLLRPGANKQVWEGKGRGWREGGSQGGRERGGCCVAANVAMRFSSACSLSGQIILTVWIPPLCFACDSVSLPSRLRL